jgi:hypothetical protein
MRHADQHWAGDVASARLASAGSQNSAHATMSLRRFSSAVLRR